MILGVHHIGLKVGDRAATTWLDHVGGGPNKRWIACPNVYVRLEDADGTPDVPNVIRPVNLPGIAHICIQSRDINEGLARGVAAGLVPISRPVDLGTEFRYLYAHTRDGVLLELEGAPFVSDALPHFWIGHVAFVAHDIEPLVDFYGRALGLKPSLMSRLEPNARIDEVAGMAHVELSAMWLPGLNLGLEFWQYHHPPVSPDAPEPANGFTHVCFECSDFDKDCARIIAQGGTSVAARESGLSQYRTASFTDPEGNHFDLMAFNDPSDPMSIAHLAHRDILDVVAAQRQSVRAV